jgi:hypothetical protein
MGNNTKENNIGNFMGGGEQCQGEQHRELYWEHLLGRGGKGGEG